MSLIESVHARAERSERVDPEHVAPLAVGAAVALAFLLDVDVVTDAFGWLDGTVVRDVAALAVDGALASLVALFAYTTRGSIFRVGPRTRSGMAPSTVLAAVLLVGVSVGPLTPLVLGRFSYVVVQATGLLYLLSILLVHLLVERGRPGTELPHALAGALLLFVPAL